MGDPSYLRYVPPSVANIPIDWSRVPEESKEHLLLWAYDWKTGVTKPLPTTIAELANWFDKSKFFGYLEPKLCTLIMDISEFGLKAVKPEDLGIPVGPRFYMKYLERVWFLLFTPGERDCVIGCSHDIITEEEDEDSEDMGEEYEIMYDEEYIEDMDEEDEEEEEEEEDEVAQDDADKEIKGLEEEETEHNKKAKGDEDMQDKGPEEVEQHEEENGHKEKEKDDKEVEDEDGEDYEPEEPGAAEEVVLSQECDAILERDVSRGNAVFVKVSKKLAGWSASMLEDSLALAQYGCSEVVT